MKFVSREFTKNGFIKNGSIKKGFTLIELMISIAIVGILASIAIPAYQTYTVKARVSELLMAGAAAQTLVAEIIQANGWTSNTSITTAPFQNLGYAASSTSNLLSLSIASAAAATAGYIVVTGQPLVQNVTFELVPTVNGDGSVSWTCKACGTTQTKYLPGNCTTLVATCPG